MEQQNNELRNKDKDLLSVFCDLYPKNRITKERFSPSGIGEGIKYRHLFNSIWNTNLDKMYFGVLANWGTDGIRLKYYPRVIKKFKIGFVKRRLKNYG